MSSDDFIDELGVRHSGRPDFSTNSLSYQTQPHRHIWQRDDRPGFDAEGETYEVNRCALCTEVWIKEGTVEITLRG